MKRGRYSVRLAVAPRYAEAVFQKWTTDPFQAWCLQYNNHTETEHLRVEHTNGNILSPEEVAEQSTAEAALSGIERSEEATRSTSTSASPRKALSPSVIHCCRCVFAAYVWHEGLVKGMLETANHLRANPHLFGDNAANEHPPPPAVAQRIALVWQYICQIIVSIVDNLQVAMSPPDSRQFRLRSLGTFNVAPVRILPQS